MSPFRNILETLVLAPPMVVLALALCESQSSSAQDVTTERYDNARTGATIAPGMNPDAVRNWNTLFPSMGSSTRSRFSCKTSRGPTGIPTM